MKTHLGGGVSKLHGEARILLRKLKRGFYRRQKQEQARRVNHQFRVDAGQVYANMREILDKDKENERPKYTPVDNKNAERKMKAAFGYSSGKVKGRGIEMPSGSRK